MPTDKPAYILRDRDGNPWGPFDSAVEVAAWAKTKWPDQDEGEPRVGWRVLALRNPSS